MSAILWGALHRYGRHEANCMGGISARPCTCGLRAILEAEGARWRVVATVQDSVKLPIAPPDPQPGISDRELYGMHEQPDQEPRS